MHSESRIKDLLNMSLSETALYRWAHNFLEGHPRTTNLLAHILIPIEKVIKIPLFRCHMCAQCVLHYTGMTCPMNCPKNLRNGPCGGVRPDGHCEVEPERECTWVAAYRRSQKLPWPEEFHLLGPPVDWTLQGSSSWVNYLTGKDHIVSGCEQGPESALEVVKTYDAKEGEGGGNQ